MGTTTIIVDYFKTPFGELVLGSLGEKLCLCDWRYRSMRSTLDERLKDLSGGTFVEGTSPVIETAKEQLIEYFNQKRTHFTIPIVLYGTPFQKSVWEALQNIEYGNTISYAELAENVHNRDAIRAVGSANGANILAVIIPCHRVIASDGQLGGYAGGIPAKRSLLTLENAPIAGQKSLFND